MINNLLPNIDEYSNNRTAIVGIGNTINGDDGIGPFLISRLKGRTQARLFDCQEVPENYIQPIIRFNPETIIIVDASDWGGSAGELRLIKYEDIGDSGFSTHNVSLKFFWDFLKTEIPLVNIVFIGVQIGQKTLMCPLSPGVEAALNKLVDFFRGRHTINHREF
ncbi:MAG: hydrogenase 3 maturation endopeptidase HyCI [Candidatus Omnitrophota bacterium]